MALDLPIQLRLLAVQYAKAQHLCTTASGLLHDDPKRQRWLYLGAMARRQSIKRLKAFGIRWTSHTSEVDWLLSLKF
jgi:hypothetical protein